jgi:DNA-binding transcriptional LysR family regulator
LELRLNLNQLLIFYYVAREKNMSLAAEGLCLTEPTVSYHIKSLEEACHMKLLNSKRKRITLTSQGETLYHYCTQIYNQAMAAQRLVDNMATAKIDVGVSPIFISAIANTVHAIFNKMGTSFKVQLYFAGTASLINDVADSKLDMAIVPSFSFLKDDLKHVRISEGEKLYFYASPGNPVSAKKQLDWQDFRYLTLILSHDAHFMNQVIGDRLSREGIKSPQINMTANNLECCKKLVMDGEGISFCLFQDIEDEVNSGTLQILHPPEDFYIKIDAVFNKGFAASPLIQEFIDSASKVFNTHINHH